MLNLSEAWKEAYSAYLLEDTARLNEDIDTLFVELSEAHDSVQKGFSLLENYFEIYNLSEGISLNEKNEEEGGEPEKKPGGALPGNYFNVNLNPNESEKIRTNIVDVYKGLLNKGFLNDLDGNSYAPVATYTVQKVGDMKFPANIIFFLKQLGSWIVNIVLYFIEKFKNIIRRLLGDHDSVTKIDMDKLKLNLNKTKEIETVSTSMRIGKMNDIIAARKLKDADVVLMEGLTDFVIKKDLPKDPEKERVIVTLDLSKDLESLRLLVNHFYELFDNAYGSFNEKLFDSTDLKLILEIFNDTLSNIKNGNPAREVSISGNVTEVSAVNAARVKENLITTNSNIEQLKLAYVQTAAKIKDVVKIINSKELLMLSDLGIDYKLLTSSTIRQMMDILKSIPVRLKEAAKMEKQLDKVKKEYDVLVRKLAEAQRSVMSLSNITYTSTYAKRMNDLFVASRYMTDIVTLRLSGLGLYIKELKDVRDILAQLNGINKRVK